MPESEGSRPEKQSPFHEYWDIVGVLQLYLGYFLVCLAELVVCYVLNEIRCKQELSNKN